MGKRGVRPTRSKSPSTKKKRGVAISPDVVSVPNEPIASPTPKDDSDNDSDNKYQFHSMLRKVGNVKPRTKSKTPEKQATNKNVNDSSSSPLKKSPRNETRTQTKKARERVQDSSQSEFENPVSELEPIHPVTTEPEEDGSILSTWQCPSSNATEIRRGSIEDVDLAVYRIRGSGVALGGCVWIRILRGNASILGGRLTANSKSFFTVSAPLAPFAVSISPVEELLNNTKNSSSEGEGDWLKDLSGKFISSIAKAKLKCQKDECVVLFAEPCEWKALNRQVELDLPHSCQFYMFRSGLPSCPDGVPAVRGMTLLDANEKVPCFSVWSEWDRVTRNISSFLKSCDSASDMRLLVCGASGTGKSVGVRCMLNYLLLSSNDVNQVVLIDTDVGQPEMNIPGLVAAHVVTRTRPGASAAWNRGVPIASRFFGNITPRDDPTLYTRCVKDIIDAGRQFALRSNCPIVVNSDGWVLDTGADLLRMVAQEVAPSHVLAMSFADAPKNDIIADTLGSVRMDCAFQLVSPLAGRSSFYSGGALLRDLSIATYFSQVISTGRVFEVDFDSVRIDIIGESVDDDRLVYLAINGCVVALGGRCERGEDVNVVGFAIVRGVDLNNRKLYICTPLSGDELDSCNRMVVSAGVQVPPALYLAMADQTDGFIKPPYVEVNVVTTGGQIKSRHNLQRKATAL